MTFSKNIYKLRKDKKLSQEAVANHLNVSRQTISNWEAGIVYPTIDKASELAIFYEVSLDELVGNTFQHTCSLLSKLINKNITLYSNEVPYVIKGEVTYVDQISLNLIIKDKQQNIEKNIFLEDIYGIESEEL